MRLEDVLAYARSQFIPVMLDDTKQLLVDTLTPMKVERILEIGTAIGYSGTIMLQCQPQAQLNTIEYNATFAAQAKVNFEHFGVAKRANIFFGDARDIVPSLTGKYQFIFMDGPKGQYEYFLPYVLDVLDEGGVLMCDNVLYHGLVNNQPEPGHKHVTIARNMASFLSKLMENKLLETQLYEIGDGITISRKL